MEVSIGADQLKVGMYVILRLSWWQHPFVSNQFLIESERQIEQILECGVKTLVYDTEKSNLEEGKASHSKIPEKKVETEPTNQEDPYEVHMEQPDIYKKILEFISNKQMSVDDQAKAIQFTSLIMMSNLLQKPTPLNITQAKKNIFLIIDMILKNDELEKRLIKIPAINSKTYTHSTRVGILGTSIAKVLFKKTDSHDLHEIGAGFFLHDLGMPCVDPTIMNKVGKLTKDELDIIRKHPEYGFQLLEQANQLTDQCRHIIMEHHERFDGSGYPQQMKGVSISIYARICSIADTYESLTAGRPYKAAAKPFGALMLMKSEMIHHFQPRLFEQFACLLVNQ